MCDIEEPGRNTSSEVSSNAAAALAIIQRSDPRVWVTPFEGPVLPEVKKIAAGSAGSSAGGSNAVGSLSTSAAKSRSLRDDPVVQAADQLARREVLAALRSGPAAPTRR